MILGHDFYFPKRVVFPILECTDRKAKRKHGKKREKTESEKIWTLPPQYDKAFRRSTDGNGAGSRAQGLRTRVSSLTYVVVA